jgi:hypothetical protein
MPQFRVEICRVGYGFKEVLVDAANESEAHHKALEDAGNLLYSEKSSEYNVNFCVELQNKPALQD